MDMYEENENVISSDEYSDEDDDDDTLMNDAVRAQDNIRSNYYSYPNKQPKWKVIDQKQKELSSLIRRNKISVIYKNKSIKWLNNKRQRERYKERTYINAKKNAIGQETSTTVTSSEQEQKQNASNESKEQKYDATPIHDIVNIEDDNNDLIRNKSNTIVGNISPLHKSAGLTNIQPEKDNSEIIDEKTPTKEENCMELSGKLRSLIEKTKEIRGKRMRSPSPSILDESIEMDIKHTEKKMRDVSSQFYKCINDMYPKFDKIATNHVDTIATDSLTAVEDKMKNLSNEIDTLNEILQAKEMEWNRLLHLKMVKEEIYSRLNKKIHTLQLKESFSNTQSQNILVELKELEFYLSEKKPNSETNHSSITIQKLIENRANMNADDLKREKNNTSRLHSILVSQNMLHAAESLENTSAVSNGDKMSIELGSKNCEMYNHLDGEKLVSNKGRQGEVRDVKSLIADFRQKNPELLPRVGKRIKSTESIAQHQGYSIPVYEKASRPHYFTKKHQYELYPNSVEEISITPIGRSKTLTSSHNIDIVNAMNNHYNVRLDNNYLKSQVKVDFDGKCSKNIQYPLCQECKTKESRFVCAGCGNQWYCSKKCQISAWDKHSELCTE